MSAWLYNMVASHLNSTGTSSRNLFMDCHTCSIHSATLAMKTSPVTKHYHNSSALRIILRRHTLEHSDHHYRSPTGMCFVPVLFSVYTSEVRTDRPYCPLSLIKFADDISMVARFKDENWLAGKFLPIKKLHSWFEESFLVSARVWMCACVPVDVWICVWASDCCC